MLLIFGGQTTTKADENSLTPGRTQCLNDLHILDLENTLWIQPEVCPLDNIMR